MGKRSRWYTSPSGLFFASFRRCDVVGPVAVSENRWSRKAGCILDCTSTAAHQGADDLQ